MKKPVYTATFKEAKKYSPGANCRNLIPVAGSWSNLTIFFTVNKQVVIVINSRERDQNARWRTSSKCSVNDISASFCSKDIE